MRSDRGFSKGDEAKAARRARLPVLYHMGAGHLPEDLKVAQELGVPIRVSSPPANILLNWGWRTARRGSTAQPRVLCAFRVI